MRPRRERDDEIWPRHFAHLAYKPLGKGFDLLGAPRHPLRFAGVGRHLAAGFLPVHAPRKVVVTHVDVGPHDAVVQLDSVEVVLDNRLLYDAQQQVLRIGVERVHPHKTVARHFPALGVQAQPIFAGAQLVLRALMGRHEPVLKPRDVDELVAVRFDQGLFQQVTLHRPLRRGVHSHRHADGSGHGFGRKFCVAVLPDLDVHRVQANIPQAAHRLGRVFGAADGLVRGGGQPGAAHFRFRIREK